MYTLVTAIDVVVNIYDRLPLHRAMSTSVQTVALLPCIMAVEGTVQPLPETKGT